MCSMACIDKSVDRNEDCFPTQELLFILLFYNYYLYCFQFDFIYIVEALRIRTFIGLSRNHHSDAR